MKFKADVEVKKDLKFRVEDCPVKAILKSVTLTENEVPAEDKQGNKKPYEYAGKTLPSIMFIFKQVGKDKDGDDLSIEDRIYKELISVNIYIKNDGTPMKEKDLEGILNSKWSRLKHIFNDGFEGKLEEQKEVVDAFTDLYENFTKVNTDKRISLFKVAFEAVVSAFNTAIEGKPIYKKDGNAIPVYLKLITDKESGNYHTTPSYINEGFIEKVKLGKDGKPKRSSLDLRPSESIILKSNNVQNQTIDAGDNAEIADDVRDSLKDI